MGAPAKQKPRAIVRGFFLTSPSFFKKSEKIKRANYNKRLSGIERIYRERRLIAVGSLFGVRECQAVAHTRNVYPLRKGVVHRGLVRKRHISVERIDVGGSNRIVSLLSLRVLPSHILYRLAEHIALVELRHLIRHVDIDFMIDFLADLFCFM